MIPWLTIRTEVAAVMLAVTGLPTPQVYWRDEPIAATWHADPMVSMRIGMTAGRGIEEEALAYSGPNADQTVTMTGQRDFTLSLRAESFEQDVSSPKFAANMLDQIRIRLRRSSTRAMVTSFALQTFEPTRWFNYKSDGRQVSCYVLDIHCSAVDTDIDTTPGAGGWINEVDINGTVDGNPVALDVKGS